jgi:hypothetical protein
MDLGIGMSLARAVLKPVTGSPPPAPVAITAIESSGWQAIYPSPPASLNPVSAPQTVTVTRQGFSPSGAATSVSDVLTLMARQRQPYPNQASLTADRVVLSDFVYAGDVIAGVSNASTRSAPQPIAMWLNHDLERATAATHVLRLAVAHAHARNGRPVAAVKFTVSDGANTIEQIVSVMSVKTYSATGLSVPHFAATMDLSSLTQGGLLTVDATIYPWVGAAFTISLDADAYPSPNLTTLRLLNDSTGAYGASYAYVDVNLGNNATAVTSATPTVAAAKPYSTIAAAAAGITAFNAANFGRSSDAGGGIIRLVEGVHTHSNFKAAGAAALIPLLIEAADPAKTATTFWQDSGASIQNGTPTMLKVKGITIRKTAGSIIFLDSGAGSAASKLIVQDCIWDLNGQSSYAGWAYRIGLFWQINNSGGAGQTALLGTNYKTTIAIGCNGGAVSNGTYHAVGNRGGGIQPKAASGAMPDTLGAFYGWNVFSRGSGVNRILGCDVAQGRRGMAVIGNIIESWGTHSDPVLQLAGDNNGQIVENFVVMQNTCVGERANLLYLDASVNVEKSGYFKFNCFQLFNIKSDVFAAQSANTGNWAARYKVGWQANVALSNSNNGGGYSPTSWLGEIASLGELAGLSAAWSNDQSNYGGDAGGGDYTPTASTALPLLPLAAAPYGIDMLGRALTSAARIGALQPL